MEVVSQAHIASNQKFIDAPTFKDVYESAEELSKKLSSLRNTLLGGS